MPKCGSASPICHSYAQLPAVANQQLVPLGAAVPRCNELNLPSIVSHAAAEPPSIVAEPPALQEKLESSVAQGDALDRSKYPDKAETPESLFFRDSNGALKERAFLFSKDGALQESVPGADGVRAVTDIRRLYYADGYLYDEQADKLGKFGIETGTELKLQGAKFLPCSGVLETEKGISHFFAGTLDGYDGPTIIQISPPPHSVAIYRVVQSDELVSTDRPGLLGERQNQTAVEKQWIPKSGARDGLTVDWKAVDSALKDGGRYIGAGGAIQFRTEQGQTICEVRLHRATAINDGQRLSDAALGWVRVDDIVAPLNEPAPQVRAQNSSEPRAAEGDERKPPPLVGPIPRLDPAPAPQLQSNNQQAAALPEAVKQSVRLSAAELEKALTSAFGDPLRYVDRSLRAETMDERSTRVWRVPTPADFHVEGYSRGTLLQLKQGKGTSYEVTWAEMDDKSAASDRELQRKEHKWVPLSLRYNEDLVAIPEKLLPAERMRRVAALAYQNRISRLVETGRATELTLPVLSQLRPGAAWELIKIDERIRLIAGPDKAPSLLHAEPKANAHGNAQYVWNLGERTADGKDEIVAQLHMTLSDTTMGYRIGSRPDANDYFLSRSPSEVTNKKHRIELGEQLNNLHELSLKLVKARARIGE